MPSPGGIYTSPYPGGWQDGSSGATPLDAAALNDMDAGIKGALQAPISPASGDLPIWNPAANGGKGGWDTTSNITIPTSALPALAITDAEIVSGANIQISKLNGFPNDVTLFMRGDGVWAAAADKSSNSPQIFDAAVETPMLGFASASGAVASHVLTITSSLTELGTTDGTNVNEIVGAQGSTVLLIRNTTGGSIPFVTGGASNALAFGFTLPAGETALLIFDGTWRCLSMSGPSAVPAQAQADLLGAVQQAFTSGVYAPNFRQGYVALTYANPTVAVDASLGSLFTLAVTNATAFTIGNPSNPPAGNQTQRITFEITNSAGVGITIAWGTAYKNAQGAGVPAAQHWFESFVWNPLSSAWMHDGGLGVTY